MSGAAADRRVLLRLRRLLDKQCRTATERWLLRKHVLERDTDGKCVLSDEGRKAQRAAFRREERAMVQRREEYQLVDQFLQLFALGKQLNKNGRPQVGHKGPSARGGDRG